MSFTQTKADDVAIATIRTLAVDTVGKANSGHPGGSHSPLVIERLLIAFLRHRRPYGHGPCRSSSFLPVSLEVVVYQQRF